MTRSSSAMAGRRAAAVVVALTFGMNVGTLWVFFGADYLSRYRVPGITDFDVLVLDFAVAEFVAVTLSYVLVGFLLAGRPGADRIAAVLLAGGALFAATPFGYIVGAELVFRAPHSELANAVFMLGPLAIEPGFALILPGLALVFPTGRFPSRRWRLPVGLVVAAMAAETMIELILPGPIGTDTSSRNPFGIEGVPAGFAAAGSSLAAAAIIGVTLLGVAAVLIRYRSGDGMLRRQLRWFIAAVLLAAVPLPISILGILGAVAGPQGFVLAIFGLLLVPISVWIAVTRYRLYEIDRLISRGVSWAALSGLLLVMYAGAVLVLEGVLGGVTQGETVAVATSTLLAAALFQPLRRRIQATVDHRFNRARYDAERTAIDFAGRLREEIDLASLSADIAGVVDTALRPTRIGVWLRLRSPSASHPTTP